MTTTPVGPAQSTHRQRGEELRRLLRDMGYSQREAASAVGVIQAGASLGTAADKAVSVGRAAVDKTVRAGEVAVGAAVASAGYVRDQAVAAYRGLAAGAEKVKNSVSRWWSERRGKATLRAAAAAEIFQGGRYNPDLRRALHDNGISRQQLMALHAQAVKAALTTDPAEAALHFQNMQATMDQMRDQAGLPRAGNDNSPWVQRPDGSFVARDHDGGGRHAAPDPQWVNGPSAAARGAATAQQPATRQGEVAPGHWRQGPGQGAEQQGGRHHAAD